MKKLIITAICTLIVMTSSTIISGGQDINLPEPVKKGGKPLMEALGERKSFREFSEKDLTMQQMSDLLWAAWGFNRQEEGKRTAPSSRNYQEIDIYVSLKSGLYIYDAGRNLLKQIHNRDIRALCGSQDFVGTAPVNLIFVADMGKLGRKEGDVIRDTDLYSPYANAGFISQNVYLWCASENMGGVVRAMIDRNALAPQMNLRSNQVIILGHTVGLPR
ncbi:MAG: SagB/ThcOx family dehydrogenase [Bacteroidales bacterium]